jgi:hypothetical protein
MSMLQYRHKSRAWNAMVTSDEEGVTRAIKDIIAHSMDMEGDRSAESDATRSDLDILLDRMGTIRERLAPRIPGIPGDVELRGHLSALAPSTLRTLQESGAWDTLIVSGEEADIDIFYQTNTPVFVGRPTDPQVLGQAAG